MPLNTPQALYKRGGENPEPYLDKFVTLSAPRRRPIHARCDTDPIIIIQIRLACLPDAGTPAQVVYSVLKAYFPGDQRGKLIYIDVPYNITCVEDAEHHRASFDDALKVLDRCVGPCCICRRRSLTVPGGYRFASGRILAFIYTHSEDTSGDLFWAKGVASDSLDTVCTRPHQEHTRD